jgi:hypothetical protein
MISLLFALSLVSRAMKYFLILTSALFFLTLCCTAQKKPAVHGADHIRKDYEQGKYGQALVKLQAAEKGGKKTGQEHLYLKILVQKALLPPAKDSAFYNHIKQFDKLEELRENCKKYLDFYGASNTESIKIKKVKQIQSDLREYPVAKVQFDEIMHLRNIQKKHSD